MVTDGWLLAFAFAIFVYFVANVLYPEQSFFFKYTLCCKNEHRRVVEKLILTFAARDLNGAGVSVCSRGSERGTI